MTQTNHLFFDLDHTLWDFERNSDLAFKAVFQQHRIALPVATFLRHYKPINQQYWKQYREEKVSKEALRYGRLKDSFDSAGLSVSDALIHQLAIDYIEVLPTYNYLFEGSHELLTYLQPKYRLHIITNGFEEVQHLKIAKAGLAPYFDQVITSEAAGVKKPHPEIFRYALEKAGALASESLMIGDNWEADVMGALAYGMDAIYFNQSKHPVGEPIKSVQQLAAIKAYL